MFVGIARACICNLHRALKLLHIRLPRSRADRGSSARQGLTTKSLILSLCVQLGLVEIFASAPTVYAKESAGGFISGEQLRYVLTGDRYRLPGVRVREGYSSGTRYGTGRLCRGEVFLPPQLVSSLAFHHCLNSVSRPGIKSLSHKDHAHVEGGVRAHAPWPCSHVPPKTHELSKRRQCLSSSYHASRSAGNTI
jgi:hypothetical protein|eukprot:1536623-Prymnesium_polylepis.1